MHVHRSSEICNLRVTEFSSHAFHSSRYFLLSSFSHFSTDKSLPLPSSSSLIHNITQYCQPSIQFITRTIFNRQRLVYVANQLLFLLSSHLDIPPFPFHQIHLTSSFRFGYSRVRRATQLRHSVLSIWQLFFQSSVRSRGHRTPILLCSRQISRAFHSSCTSSFRSLCYERKIIRYLVAERRNETFLREACDGIRIREIGFSTGIDLLNSNRTVFRSMDENDAVLAQSDTFFQFLGKTMDELRVVVIDRLISCFIRYTGLESK